VKSEFSIAISSYPKDKQAADEANKKKCKKNHISDNVLLYFCIYILQRNKKPLKKMGKTSEVASELEGKYLIIRK